MLDKELLCAARSFCIKGKQEYAARRSIQAVTRIDHLPNLVAQLLHCKFSRIFIQWATMDEQSRRLIDGYIICILVNNLQRIGLEFCIL